ncbi:MAG: TolC family protein [Cetobacterium sp.]|uniref:TolC family protein n=1 Tax=Cetobacterium sp. TaxID=2071632 RepID=UPI003F34A988
MRKTLTTMALLVSSLAYCQELDLEEVLRRVKQDNYSIKKQDLSIENSVISTKNYYKKRFLPSVGFGAEGELSEIGDKGVGPKSVSMKIDLDIGRQALNQYKIKKNEFELAEINRSKTWFSLQEQVISTYFSYLSSKKKTEYTEKTLKSLEIHRRKLEKMLKGGNLIPKNELLKISIDIEENNLDLIRSRYNETVLKQKLYTFMGLELDQNIEFKEINPETLVLSQRFNELAEVERKGVKASMNSRVNSLEMENAEYKDKIAKAELLPKFYVKPEYLFEDAGYTEKGGRVTVGFSWNFEWGNTLNDIEISKNSLEIAKMNSAESFANLTLQVRESFERLKMAKLSLDISNKKILLMRENLKLDTSRFENNLMGSKDYLDSVNSLKEAEERLYEHQQEIFLLDLKLQNLIS